MSLAQKLRRWADRMDPPANIPDPVEMPDIPAGCEPVSDKTEYAQTRGHSHALFKKRRIVYSDPAGGMHEISIKDNVHAPGCGHNLMGPSDIGFLSTDSGLPVCKTCEKQYNRMRAVTRHENCKCFHLVAPHELKRVAGYGYLCPACLKKHERFKMLKPAARLLGFFLKPLIDETNEVPYEDALYPPDGGYFPPVQNDPLPWTGHSSASPPPYEVGRNRSRQPNINFPPAR